MDCLALTAVMARLQAVNRWNPDAVIVPPLTPISPDGGDEKLHQRSRAAPKWSRFVTDPAIDR